MATQCCHSLCVQGVVAAAGHVLCPAAEVLGMGAGGVACTLHPFGALSRGVEQGGGVGEVGACSASVGCWVEADRGGTGREVRPARN